MSGVDSGHASRLSVLTIFIGTLCDKFPSGQSDRFGPASAVCSVVSLGAMLIGIGGKVRPTRWFLVWKCARLGVLLSLKSGFISACVSASIRDSPRLCTLPLIQCSTQVFDDSLRMDKAHCVMASPLGCRLGHTRGECCPADLSPTQAPMRQPPQLPSQARRYTFASD